MACRAKWPSLSVCGRARYPSLGRVTRQEAANCYAVKIMSRSSFDGVGQRIWRGARQARLSSFQARLRIPRMVDGGSPASRMRGGPQRTAGEVGGEWEENTVRSSSTSTHDRDMASEEELQKSKGLAERAEAG